MTIRPCAAAPRKPDASTLSLLLSALLASSCRADSLATSFALGQTAVTTSSITRQLFKAEDADALTAKLPNTPEDHCQLTKGSWCTSFYYQEENPRPAPPQGDKDCPKDCNGVGQCNHDTGYCNCPVGWQGTDCSEPRTRPCWRMGKDKRDKNWTKWRDWSHSRCAGICDDMNSMCYCPPETKFGHIMAPEGSPLGTPPVKVGRPLYWCQPSSVR